MINSEMSLTGHINVLDNYPAYQPYQSTQQTLSSTTQSTCNWTTGIPIIPQSGKQTRDKHNTCSLPGQEQEIKQHILRI